MPIPTSSLLSPINVINALNKQYEWVAECVNKRLTRLIFNEVQESLLDFDAQWEGESLSGNRVCVRLVQSIER